MQGYLIQGCFFFVMLTVVTVPLRAEKVVLEYWDKWTGTDAEAMQSIVDDFNASQDRIEVRYSAISMVDVKVMLAIAGRRPPDVAGLWSSKLANYVENNALLPLDGRAMRAEVKEQDYVPSIWNLCHYRNHLWALPSTPYTLGLYWNKKLFRGAGLDPERGPRTIAELEEYNAKLTHLKSDGHGYQTFGYLPKEPGWWNSIWCRWFGGELWNGEDKITATSEGNRRAMEWFTGYSKRYGFAQVSTFLQESSAPSSPLNPFIQGRLAMELNGPWFADVLRKFGPADFEFGVAPFPTLTGEGPPVTLVDTDILTIPVGAPHPREAFEFLRYVNRQDVAEKLCIARCQISPLAQVSDGFWKKHPNPCIRMFYDLAKSPGAQPMPRMTLWIEYDTELTQAMDEMWALRQTPEEGLRRVQERMQPKLDRSVDRWKNLSGKLEKIWAEEEK